MVPNVYLTLEKRLLYSSVNNDVVLITTVEEKINKYTVREYLNDKKSHELQNIIGRTSTQDLIKYLDKNMIPNCPVTSG